MTISTSPLLADTTAGITELKKNPMAIVEQGHGKPVAILKNNRPAFYAVPAKLFEEMYSKLDDIALMNTVKERLDQEEVEVSLNDL